MRKLFDESKNAKAAETPQAVIRMKVGNDAKAKPSEMWLAVFVPELKVRVFQERLLAKKILFYQI